MLLVDDEPLLLMVLGEALLDAGHIVQQAANATEAIEHLDAQSARFTAIVTDLHMPGPINGVGLIEYARANHPALPIVLSTARSSDITPDWVARHQVLMLDKPYAMETLIEALAWLLH